MCIPFPDINSTLAQEAHMYICIDERSEKGFIKCQSFKPTHLAINNPPLEYILEESNCSRNPFVRKTTIDCDKSFLSKEVVYDKGMLKHRGVCEDLFNDILVKIKHQGFFVQLLDDEDLVRLNRLINYRD